MTAAVREGWVEGGSFLGSLIAGTLLGFVLDRLLGTTPWLVVVGIVLGSYSGFMRVWRYTKALPPGESRTRPTDRTGL